MYDAFHPTTKDVIELLAGGYGGTAWAQVVGQARETIQCAALRRHQPLVRLPFVDVPQERLTTFSLNLNAFLFYFIAYH